MNEKCLVCGELLSDPPPRSHYTCAVNHAPTPEAQAEPPDSELPRITQYKATVAAQAERITALEQLLDEQLQRGNQWYDAALQAEARATRLLKGLTDIINTWHTDEIYRIASEAIAQAAGEAKA